ncbi:MAG: OsmC family protein [Verrucomicrobia bacterium]|nr:OsmC family protein [Verrucomicrobiota bacterium]
MTADVLLTNLKWVNGDRASLHAPGCPDVSLSQPLLFGGDPDRWSPEELLTGAVEADVLMTFLQFIKRRQVGLRRYASHAEAHLEDSPAGLRFTGITLTLTIEVDAAADAEAVTQAIAWAESHSPIIHALNSPVRIHRAVTVAESSTVPA